MKPYNVRPEIRGDLETLSEHWPECERRIRAELLRLHAMAENRWKQYVGCVRSCHVLVHNINEVKAELAALKSMIASAPVQVYGRDDWHEPLIGKRVALVAAMDAFAKEGSDGRWDGVED